MYRVYCFMIVLVWCTCTPTEARAKQVFGDNTEIARVETKPPLAPVPQPAPPVQQTQHPVAIIPSTSIATWMETVKKGVDAVTDKPYNRALFHDLTGGQGSWTGIGITAIVGFIVARCLYAMADNIKVLVFG